MDKMLYVSMSGASQNTLAMRAHANNLANISTSGFRRDFEQARSMQVFGDSFPARVFAMSERPGTDFSHGSLQETGNELDIAIDGDGFVAVQAPDGSEAYVRTAGMHIDALGMLRTGDGLPVLGNGGPIAVPPEEKVEIGQDGTISIRALGENPNVVAVVDRIKLVNPNLKHGEGYRRPAALQAAAGRAGAAGRRQREGGLRFPGKQQRERGGRDDRDPLAVPSIRAAREDDAHRRGRFGGHGAGFANQLIT